MEVNPIKRARACRGNERGCIGSRLEEGGRSKSRTQVGEGLGYGGLWLGKRRHKTEVHEVGEYAIHLIRKRKKLTLTKP